MQCLHPDQLGLATLASMQYVRTGVLSALRATFGWCVGRAPEETQAGTATAAIGTAAFATVTHANLPCAANDSVRATWLREHPLKAVREWELNDTTEK